MLIDLGGGVKGIIQMLIDLGLGGFKGIIFMVIERGEGLFHK
jgi:hypothetical protein